MADSSGMAEIRGLDVDKTAKGFADEMNVMKKHVTLGKTGAREIRWYQKTSGFLDSTDSSGVTQSLIPTADGAVPVVVEQSWTRNTSYSKKFMLETPWISEEDIKDSDIPVLATNVRDLTRGVQRQVDQRIIAILTNAAPATPTQPLTGSVTVQNTAAVGTGWDDDVNGNPIKDMLTGQQLVRSQGYEVSSIKVGMNSVEHKNLVNWLINVKGSSIPELSSELAKSGVVLSLLGNKIIVSENFTTDWVVQWLPVALTYKSFSQIRGVVINDPLIGKKFRVAEHGEAILTDPNACHVISDTVT